MDLINQKYKFNDLKVYASTEWLAGNKKKYRQVFDRHECSYIYAELSLHNKFFDQEEWEINFELRCFSVKKGGKQLCSLPFQRTVSKFEPTVYYREGWGNKTKGSFWEKGTYYWEAWIEDKKVGTKYFYVEDAGLPASDIDPFIELHSANLYEGPYEDVDEDERVYFQRFGAAETRYVYTEILFHNVNIIQTWHCELFVKFFNDARELKGQVVRLQKIEKGQEQVKIAAGWGSNVKGSWKKDRYTVEIIFMDQLLAIVPFEVDEEYEEGNIGVILPEELRPEELPPTIEDERTFDEVMEDMDALIGLKSIKEQVRDHAKYIRFLQLRKEKGFEEKDEINVHSVFIGNPGTGKTTVASMMGKLYKKMGLLSKGHVHVVDRVDLVGEYIGQTAPKVKDAIEKARGGVLFIDEAYSLARSEGDSKDFGREVIEILVKELSNGEGDLAVIVAGYPKEMKYFLDSNPGLKSRFRLHFEFPDYLPQELSQIGDYASQEKGVVFTTSAKAKIDEFIVNAYRNRDRTFGNARFIFDLIEKSKINLGLRSMSHKDPDELSEEQLSKIKLQDVEKIEIKKRPELPDIPVDEDLLTQSLGELNRLIGMEPIKVRIRELVSLVRYYRETNRNVLNSFFLHTVFIGNPGTGKTTVARILAKIYKALGILERGHMVETDRQGLVAGYVGQTAIKTAEKIELATGGVLFIDEAYSLTMKSGGAHGDFGDEAIQTLLKRMEDSRGQFFVFVAGYPDNMEAFLKANPGLNSRFDKMLKFDDYNSKELLEIAFLMLEEEKLSLSLKAEAHLKDYFTFLHEFRDKYFGNARVIRNVVQEAVKQHSLRLSRIDSKERKKLNQNELSLEDVSMFKTDKSDFIFNKKTIGFKRAQEGG